MAAVNPHFASFFEEAFADSDSEAEFEGFDDEEAAQDQGPVFDPGFYLNWSANIDEPPELPFTGTLGILIELPEQPSPGDIFTFFLSDEELRFISTEMNRYVQQVKVLKADHLQAHPHARLNAWEDTASPELRRFFAVIQYMGTVVHADINRYWSTDPVLANSFVPNIITKNRLLFLFTTDCI